MVSELGTIVADGTGFLHKKYGPFEGWQWASIGGGSFVVYKLARSRFSSVGAASGSTSSTPSSATPVSSNVPVDYESQLTQIQAAISALTANQPPVAGSGSNPGTTPNVDLAILGYNLGQAATLPQFQANRSQLLGWQQDVNEMLQGTIPINNDYISSILGWFHAAGLSNDTLINTNPTPVTNNPPPATTPTSPPPNVTVGANGQTDYSGWLALHPGWTVQFLNGMNTLIPPGGAPPSVTGSAPAPTIQAPPPSYIAPPMTPTEPSGYQTPANPNQPASPAHLLTPIYDGAGRLIEWV